VLVRSAAFFLLFFTSGDLSRTYTTKKPISNVFATTIKNSNKNYKEIIILKMATRRGECIPKIPTIQKQFLDKIIQSETSRLRQEARVELDKALEAQRAEFEARTESDQAVVSKESKYLYNLASELCEDIIRRKSKVERQMDKTAGNPNSVDFLSVHLSTSASTALCAARY
jgi:hypothetical protein